MLQHNEYAGGRGARGVYEKLLEEFVVVVLICAIFLFHLRSSLVIIISLPIGILGAFKVIGSDLWSTDPGFADATKATGVPGICGSGIIEAISEMVSAGIIDQQGLIGEIFDAT